MPIPEKDSFDSFDRDIYNGAFFFPSFGSGMVSSVIVFARAKIAFSLYAYTYTYIYRIYRIAIESHDSNARAIYLNDRNLSTLELLSSVRGRSLMDDGNARERALSRPAGWLSPRSHPAQEAPHKVARIAGLSEKASSVYTFLQNAQQK